MGGFNAHIHVAFVIFFRIIMLAFCSSQTQLNGSIAAQIDRYAGDVQKILHHILEGDGKGVAFNRLARFVDKFGSRFTGSQSLEDAIDFMKFQFQAEGFENVVLEDVQVPVWKRGHEQATMLQPRLQDLKLLGVFMSPAGNVSASVLVVRSFEELQEKRLQVPGKIVVYNQPWINYVAGYKYRTEGPSKASHLGAVGVLVRSLAPFSIYTPHTGSHSWANGVVKIPAACITSEDAEMLQRMQDAGDNVTVHIEMHHEILPNQTSRNLIAEVRGSEFPDEYVLFGGHIDSWDVGVGAMDDGGGMMVTRQILTTLKRLNLNPRRTMRLVFWTAEEQAVLGGKQYFDAHKDLIPKISFAVESDYGTFGARGLALYNASESARDIIQQILTAFLTDLGTTYVNPNGSLGKADIDQFIKHGVPGASLETYSDMYFYFHHTAGDRMTVQNSTAMDQCAALLTVATYVVANLDAKLPRVPPPPLPTARTVTQRTNGRRLGSRAPEIAIHSEHLILLTCVSSLVLRP